MLHGALAIVLFVVLGAAIPIGLAVFEPVVADLGDLVGRGRERLWPAEPAPQAAIISSKRMSARDRDIAAKRNSWAARFALGRVPVLRRLCLPPLW